MKSSEFIPANNRQGRRKAAKASFLQANKKRLGYVSSATALGLVAAGLVGVQAANAETDQQAYDRCMNRADIYVPDANGSTTGDNATGWVIDLEDESTDSWSYIKDAIVNTTRFTNPSGEDTIILCSNGDFDTIADSTISLQFSGVRLVNGTLPGYDFDDFGYEELSPAGEFVGVVPTNRIRFDDGLSGALFNSVNTDLTLAGFVFDGFETVVSGDGGDVAVNASYVINSSYTAIELDGGDSYSQSGSLELIGTGFAYNRQAVFAEGLDSMLVDSSSFYRNGSSNTVDRLVDAEEELFNDQVQGGAMYLREFDMDSQYDVTIRDSQFTSNEANMGGALYLENADVLVSNVEFNENIAFKGGAIRATDDSNLKIESESEFTDNNSVYTGGAIDMWDSELSVGDLTSTRVLFENNKSGFEDLYFGGNSAPETRNGGAIYGDNTEIFIQGTYFLDNFAEAGAAVFLTENSSMTGSGEITFKDNVAVSTGGAIQVEESTVVDLTDADFNNNQATSYDVARGGAVHADESTLTFTDSQFRFNQANIGGAIYSTKLDASPQITENDLTLVNTDFVSNSALNAGGIYESDTYMYAGGAIHIWEGDLNITGGAFNSNSAGDNGGAINARNTGVIIDGTAFDENFTTLIENRAFDTAEGLPGIQAEFEYDEIMNDLYDGLSEPDKGGAIMTYAGSTLDIIDSSFTNSESHTGGAIYAYNVVNLTDTDMSGNFARFNGGAVSAEDEVIISGGQFTGNRSREDGGAINSERNDTIIQDATFSGNFADSDGGAVYSGHDVYVYDSAFLNNTSLDGDGGAIYAQDDITSYTSVFDNNEAAYDGGALNAENDDIEGIVGSTFTNNRAGYDGGAIYVGDDVEVLRDSYFAGNTAFNDGGAIYAGYYVGVSDTTFRSNTAGDDGGAIYANYGAFIQGSTFEGNYATSQDESRGGAVYAAYVEVSDSSFTSNVAAEYGGAIYAEYGLEVSDSFFSQNTAGEEGGALYINNSDPGDFVTRSVFTYNEVRDLNFDTYYNNFIFYSLTDDSQSIYASGTLDITNSTFVSSETNERSQIDIDNGYVMFNTFVGESQSYNELIGNGEDSQIFGNIFAGGTERVFQNGVAVTRDGKPVFKYFVGGTYVGEYSQDVRRNSLGQPIDEFGDVIDSATLASYYGFTENQAISFADYDDTGEARFLNFFTSSVEKQSSGINLHFKPAGNLGRDFIYGNKVGQIAYPESIDDVADVQGYLQWTTNATANDNGRYNDLWDLLTANRDDFQSVPSSIEGPRVGIDQSSALRTLIWDAGAREFGGVVITPVTPPPSGGGGAPAAAAAPVVETFTSVTASLRGFAPNSAKLTAAMKASIKKVIAANPGATTISCKGFTSAPPTAGDKALSKARGKAVCDYVRKLDPTLTVKVLKGAYENTPGQQIRRVRIVLK